MNNDAMQSFFIKRVKHLELEDETGRLANHQALAALAAYNAYLITGDDQARKTAEDRLALTLSWQNKEEGWFQEYEGADPGYHTCSIDFLAKLRKKRMEKEGSDDPELKSPPQGSRLLVEFHAPGWLLRRRIWFA